MVEYRQIETPKTAVENLSLWLGMRIGDVLCVNGFVVRPEQQEVIDCWLESIIVLGKAAGLTREDFRPLSDAPGFAAAWRKYEETAICPKDGKPCIDDLCYGGGCLKLPDVLR